MGEPVIRQAGADLQIVFADGRTLVVSPQECSDLADLADHFLQERHRVLEPLPRRDVHRNGRVFKVVRSAHWRFWRDLEAGRWEPTTFEIFDHFLHPACVVLDIGAWIGPTALYAAQIAKAVFAFEPDPIAFPELRRNLAANADREWSRRLTLINAAVVPVGGRVRLGSRAQGGDSMSSTLFADPSVSWEVDAVVLEQFIVRHHLQDTELFIKMDIEGGEYELLPSLRRLFARGNVHLYLSLHPANLAAELKERSGAGITAKLARRFRIVRSHYRVLRALAFKNLYDGSGRSLSFRRLLYRVLRHGTLPEVLLGTAEQWRRSPAMTKGRRSAPQTERSTSDV